MVNKKVKKGSPVELKLSITNTESVLGKEVVQGYVRDLKKSEEHPLKELKAFKKVEFNRPSDTFF